MGGGSWGTALAILWARDGHEVSLWVRDPETARRFSKARRNLKYLHNYPFPDGLSVTSDLEKTLAENDLLINSVPVQAYRDFLTQVKPMLRDAHRMVLTSKGIELNTHYLPSEIVVDVLDESWQKRMFTLSGPSFAKEVAAAKPTTVVLAGPEDSEELKMFQHELNSATFRLYRNTDVVGVELCGAMKNVIAIASGMVMGLNLGNNTMAGLITRGLAEISRLGVALGGERHTFAGLAGMGDLILTCTGKMSRNLSVGLELAKGLPLKDVLSNLGMVAEGVHTAKSAFQLGAKLEVELPITEMVHNIIYEGLAPTTAVHALMTRKLKAEGEVDGA